MQWILLVMLVSSNGNMEYQQPTIMYSKKACKDAQMVISQMAPNNATVTVITACVSRGGRE